MLVSSLIWWCERFPHLRQVISRCTPPDMCWRAPFRRRGCVGEPRSHRIDSPPAALEGRAAGSAQPRPAERGTLDAHPHSAGRGCTAVCAAVRLTVPALLAAAMGVPARSRWPRVSCGRAALWPRGSLEGRAQAWVQSSWCASLRAASGGLLCSTTLGAGAAGTTRPASAQQRMGATTPS